MASAASLLAFGVTWIAIPLLIPRAGRWSLIDHPGGRKTHARSTPVVGGVAITAGILTGLLLLGGLHLRDRPLVDGTFGWSIAAAVVAGALLLLVVGVVDDRRELGAVPKLLAQVAAALPLVTLHEFSLFQQWIPAWAASVCALLWILAVVNAFNMLDGIDGLMGSVALLCALALALLAWAWRVNEALFLLATLIGSLVGFLRWNLPPARTFAGDGGSLMIGYLIATTSLRIVGHDPDLGAPTSPYATLAILLILAIPFYDLVSVVWLRMIERRWLFHGDTSHLAHRLVRRGLSPRRTLVFICGCTLVTALAGLVLARVGRDAAPAVIAQCAVVMGLLALMEAKTRPAS
ncbi:MAG: MraY family glycosyltransferase [Gemmatimonadaceae bacterium]|jgi:UDP-GlcNAc:undecaprenyl-phosphate GlcNAc-1-phosphate transferase